MIHFKMNLSVGLVIHSSDIKASLIVSGVLFNMCSCDANVLRRDSALHSVSFINEE